MKVMNTRRLIGVIFAVAVAMALVASYAAAARPMKSSRHARRAQSESLPLQFAQCMRAHGADQPDPAIRPGRTGPQLDIVDSGPNVAAARAACDPILKQIAGEKAGAMGPAGVAAARAQAQQFVACMSARGVELGQPQPPLYDVGALLDSADRAASKETAPVLEAAKQACAAARPQAGS